MSTDETSGAAATDAQNADEGSGGSSSAGPGEVAQPDECFFEAVRRWNEISEVARAEGEWPVGMVSPMSRVELTDTVGGTSFSQRWRGTLGV